MLKIKGNFTPPMAPPCMDQRAPDGVLPVESFCSQNEELAERKKGPSRGTALRD
jgi:hypothetical protein